MTRFFVLALAVAMASLGAAHVRAQSLSPVSIEATLGAGKGWTGGQYLGSRSGVAADILLGVRLRRAGSGALAAGLSASAQGGGTSTTMCRLETSDTCIPAFPDFFAVAPLVGWESGAGRLRMLVGPAFVQARGEGSALGVQSRLDLAVPLAGRFGAVASIRPTIIPDYRGDTVGLLAFGVGLRFR